MQLIWVRGHSGNKGNDRADLLAQWGKASGPHSRIPLRGETKERAKSRAELRKKIEELQKAEQKAKPSGTNQNNQSILSQPGLRAKRRCFSAFDAEREDNPDVRRRTARRW